MKVSLRLKRGVAQYACDCLCIFLLLSQTALLLPLTAYDAWNAPRGDDGVVPVAAFIFHSIIAVSWPVGLMAWILGAYHFHTEKSVESQEKIRLWDYFVKKAKMFDRNFLFSHPVLRAIFVLHVHLLALAVWLHPTVGTVYLVYAVGPFLLCAAYALIRGFFDVSVKD
jgi:hypothetical protein